MTKNEKIEYEIITYKIAAPANGGPSLKLALNANITKVTITSPATIKAKVALRNEETAGLITLLDDIVPANLGAWSNAVTVDIPQVVMSNHSLYISFANRTSSEIEITVSVLTKR